MPSGLSPFPNHMIRFLTATSAETGDTGWQTRSSEYTNQSTEGTSIPVLTPFLESVTRTVLPLFGKVPLPRTVSHPRKPPLGAPVKDRSRRTALPSAGRVPACSDEGVQGQGASGVRGAQL